MNTFESTREEEGIKLVLPISHSLLILTSEYFHTTPIDAISQSISMEETIDHSFFFSSHIHSRLSSSC